jgi:hypothetical protein
MKKNKMGGKMNIEKKKSSIIIGTDGIEAMKIRQIEGKDLELELINTERRDIKTVERYRKIGIKDRKPRYLRKENIENTSRVEEMRALIKLRKLGAGQ